MDKWSGYYYWLLGVTKEVHQEGYKVGLTGNLLGSSIGGDVKGFIKRFWGSLPGGSTDGLGGFPGGHKEGLTGGSLERFIGGQKVDLPGT